MAGSNHPRELSVSELATAMEACRSNSQELIEETALLISANRNARAFAVVHTACEELAKFFMFEMAARRVILGKPPNWKRFWQRVRNHESKLAQVEVRLRYALSLDGESDDLAMTGIDVLSRGLVPRNMSLYTEANPDGVFHKPSDIDWSVPLPALRALANRLLKSSNEFGRSASDIAVTLGQPQSPTTHAHLLEIMRISVNRLKNEGVSREDIINEPEHYMKNI